MIFLGKLKFHLDRLQNYASKVQFFLVLYLFVAESGVGWYWFLLGIPVAVVLVWFDRRYVAPGELAEYMRVNPAWDELKKDLE